MAIFEKPEPEEVQFYGKPMVCEMCENDTFWKRQAQLNTAVATFFDLDWANPSATCIVCSHCGYIHWFLPM